MKIIATLPASGFRLSLERAAATPPDAATEGYPYRGDLHFADRVEPAACTVFGDGTVRVDAAPAELHEKVRLLVRAAVKGPLREGLAPPRRIQRWRDGT